MLEENLKTSFSVDKKNIAIIGATGLLGSQYAKYLSSLGANIIIGDINFAACEKLSDEINLKGYHCFPSKIDITDEISISNFFDKINDKYGKLDVLINNAQIKPEGFYNSFENYTKKTLEQVIDGNLIGVTLSCRQAIKMFLEEGKGVIINISSTYGVVAPDQRIYDGVENIYFPDQKFSSPVSYAISKAGIIQLTKYLSSYYGDKNIRVNCLTPGGVFEEHDDLFNNQYSSRTTIGRMAEKNEYNGAILFLCSDASSYMTGSNLIVDGGWTAI